MLRSNTQSVRLMGCNAKKSKVSRATTMTSTVQSRALLSMRSQFHLNKVKCSITTNAHGCPTITSWATPPGQVTVVRVIVQSPQTDDHDLERKKTNQRLQGAFIQHLHWTCRTSRHVRQTLTPNHRGDLGYPVNHRGVRYIEIHRDVV